MERFTWPTVICLIGVFGVASARAATDEQKCLARAASQAASLYAKTSREFLKCATAAAKGSTCNGALRDAAIQLRLQKARERIRKRCGDQVVAAWAYESGDAFKIELAGRAAGEGRYTVDSTYGRKPETMSQDVAVCARLISRLVSKVGKKEIKTRIKCGSSCSASTLSRLDEQWDKADGKIARACTPAALDAVLATTDPTGYLDEMRHGAQRVAAAAGHTTPLNAFASVVSPTQNEVITPASFPISVAIKSGIGGVPHSSYVTFIEVGGPGVGHRAEYSPTTDTFDYDLYVWTPDTDAGADYQIPLKAYSYLGVFTTVRTVKFNYAELSPGVVIDTPATGTITSAGTIGLSGRVIGNLDSPQPTLTVTGAAGSVPFDGGGNWSTTVSLTSDLVQILEARVDNGVSPPSRDTVVVLHGQSLPIGNCPPNCVESGLHDRLNNSGFGAVESLIMTELGGALSPAAIGYPDPSCATGYGILAAGYQGCIDQFSFGTPGVPVIGAFGPKEILLGIDLPQFHLYITGIEQDLGLFTIECTLTYDAANINLFVDADLQPNEGEQPPAEQFTAVMNEPVQITFTNDSASLGGNVLCVLGELFTDVKGEIQAGFRDAIESELPATLNETLAGIDVSTPIAEETGVLFEGLFRDVPEDTEGITFAVDENAVALEPVPDAPEIVETLLPLPPIPAPSLTSVIPNGDQLWWVPGPVPYDLAFCLSDGLLNRFMAAFMLQGVFNQELAEFPGIGALTTDLLTLLFGDPAFAAACPGCSVVMALAPTAAPVSRPPNPGEDGDIVLIIPNYRVDMIAYDADDNPISLAAATLVFELPLELGAAGGVISPQIGTPTILNFKLLSNPIGIAESSVATIEETISALFPEMASSLGDLFTAVQLPPFQGLQLSAWGSGYNNSCAALYLGFNAPPPSPTPTPTETPTLTPSRTPTPEPTLTPTGAPPLGSQSFVLGTGSQAKVDGIFALTFNLTGGLTIVGGVPNPADGVAEITIPQASVYFAPVATGLPMIDWVCVKIEGDGLGEIDCNGGDLATDVTQTQDHNVQSDTPPCDPPNEADLKHANVCNGPAVTTFAGVSEPGDIVIEMPVALEMRSASELGPDGVACTDDDPPPSMEPQSVRIAMTSGVSTATIEDFNNTPGQSKTATVTGVPVTCEDFRSGLLTGTKVGGAFTSIDAPTVGDIVVTLVLAAQ